MIILKCTECGNTFQKDRVVEGDALTCPVCDANYRAVTKNGKISLVDFVFDENDLGEL